MGRLGQQLLAVLGGDEEAGFEFGGVPGDAERAPRQQARDGGEIREFAHSIAPIAGKRANGPCADPTRYGS
jgi:hypothetical protein